MTSKSLFHVERRVFNSPRLHHKIKNLLFLVALEMGPIGLQ